MSDNKTIAIASATLILGAAAGIAGTLALTSGSRRAAEDLESELLNVLNNNVPQNIVIDDFPDGTRKVYVSSKGPSVQYGTIGKQLDPILTPGCKKFIYSPQWGQNKPPLSMVDKAYKEGRLYKWQQEDKPKRWLVFGRGHRD
ncbi:hypothetical protein GOV06_02145 [Candidatus Woesearchaeota archaeon]|nr:hypothetical protein [Candidatus Woesearchaeota archaeon]